MNKLLLASKHKGDLSKLNVLKTQSINQFYVIKMESSSAIYFQITIGNEIVLEGALQKSTIINNRGNVIRHALNSADGQFRVVVCLSFTPIDQLNDSLNSFYKLRHGLFSSD